MLRYYFNTREGDICTADREGTLLSDEQAARLEAKRLIAQIASDAVVAQIEILVVTVSTDEQAELFSYSLDYCASVR